MKKFILSAALLIAGLAQAQIEITGNDEIITEGKTFTFNTLTASTASLHLVATNNSTENVHIQLKMNSITNSDGSAVQFCFGTQCYFSIQENDAVPNGGYLAEPIEPGESNSPQDKFLNENPGIVAGQDVIYNMSFLKVTSTGELLETLVTFNYKYSPTASVNEFTALQNMGVTLGSTVVKSQIDVTSNNAATLNLYSTTGQLVKTIAVAQGNSQVDISAIAAGVYVASFTTQDKKSGSIKIVKN